jgi:hypothetical protein
MLGDGFIQHAETVVGDDNYPLPLVAIVISLIVVLFGENPYDHTGN